MGTKLRQNNGNKTPAGTNRKATKQCKTRLSDSVEVEPTDKTRQIDAEVEFSGLG
jgi:hypothetical protein